MDLQAITLKAPASTHDKLEDLTGPRRQRKTRTEVLIELAERYRNEPILKVDDPIRCSGFKIPNETVTTLDEIVRKNGLKSRNQAVTLIIERAWEEAQSKTNV